MTEGGDHRNDEVKQYREMLHKHIDDFGNDITNDLTHLSEVALSIFDAVGELTKESHTIRRKLGQHRQKNGAKCVLCGCSTYGKVLKLIVKCAVGIEGFIAKNISGFLCLFAKLRHSFCTRLDERVQFLGRLTEDGHRNCITLGLVFHFTESIYDFPIDGIAVTHITLGIINGNTELLVSLGHFVHLGSNGL